MSIEALRMSDSSAKKVNFKGEMRQTPQGNSYYHSNSGTKIGVGIAGVTGGLVGLSALLVPLTEKLIEKSSKSTDEKSLELQKLAVKKKQLKAIALPVIAAMAVHVGCGALIDAIRNDKAAKTADYVKTVGVKRALRTDSNIEISDKNHPYYYSNSGAKYGALLGMVTLPLLNLMFKNHNQKIKIPKVVQISLNAAYGAFGGALLGAWADHNSNKKAEKLS